MSRGGYKWIIFLILEKHLFTEYNFLKLSYKYDFTKLASQFEIYNCKKNEREMSMTSTELSSTDLDRH